jgi:hypothetical protein
VNVANPQKVAAMKPAVVLILTILAVPTVCAAADAPPQLRNKTVTASWSVNNTFVAPNGKVFTPTVSQSRTIYVSSAGRFFVKGSVSSRNGSETHEVAPGDRTPAGTARSMGFEGGKIVGMAVLKTGAAGRMVISFDQGYSTCSVDVMVGRPGPNPMTVRAPNGVPLEVRSQIISGQSCSISDGNPFASQ